MNRTETKKKQAYIISCMIAFLTLLIISNFIQYNGIAYLSVAVYLTIFVDIAMNNGTSSSVSRLIRLRLTKGQYRNAQKMKKDLLLLQTLFALLFGGVVLGTAGLLSVHVFRLQLSYLIVLLFVPSIVLKAITVVKLGIAKGEGLETPYLITDILRQLLTLLLSLLFCKLLADYGTKVSNLLGENNFIAMYGGIGVAIAYLISNLAMFLFVLFTSAANRRRRGAEQDGMRTTHSFGENVMSFLRNRMIHILTCIAAFLAWPIGLIFMRKSFADSQDMIIHYGVYITAFCGICGMIICFILLVMIPVCGKTIAFLRKDEQRFARNMLQNGMHIGAVHAIFFATFLSVSSHRLASVLFHSQEEIAGKMLKYGSFSILTFVLAIYFGEFLILTGKKMLVLVSVIATDVIYVLLITIFLNRSQSGIQSLVYGILLATIVLTLALGWFTYNKMRISMDWMQFIIIPVCIACIAGLINYFVDKLFTPHLGEHLSLFLCFIISGSVYWLGLMITRNFRTQDLEGVPGGKMIIALGQMLHVLS